MYQLNPASIEDSEIYNQNNNQNKNIYKKPNTNRTLKNKNVSFLNEEIKNNKDSINPKEFQNKEKLSNISKLISNLHNSTEDDDNNDENFKLYNETMNNMTNLTNSNIIEQELNKMNNHNDNNISGSDYQNSKINKTFSHIDESYKVNSDFINTLNNSSNNLLNNNDLLNKLDYIIHLLEEQHNEKTNTINEELILYLFLGIFMIFVLDSFARASKYVR
jgi:hypothetical protein